MSKIVELYVRELTREGSTMTINDVPKKLRKQVEDAINNKQTGEIEIKYSQKADTYTAKGEPDWKAYIDVDLSEQHARYYDENGNIVW